MYRTYRELYRQKTEITKIGSGAGALKIGKYLSVGLDVLLLGAAVGIFPGVLIAAVLHAIYPPISKAIWIVIIGFTAGWAAKQFDPQGKSVLTWVMDVMAYLRRPRISDGFKPVKLDKKPLIYRYAFYAVDQGIARSTPIYGNGAFTLHKPLGVKILRDGSWILKRSHHPLEPGKYRVVDGKINKVTAPPKLRRHG